MSTAEGEGFPESLNIAELVSEIDDTIAAMKGHVDVYLRRPTSGNFNRILALVVDHVSAVQTSLEHILLSDEDDKTKVRMINSLLTQTIRLHASGLNSVIGSEEYSTDGKFVYSVSDAATGEEVDLEDPEVEFSLPDPEYTLTMITTLYTTQIGEDMKNLREMVEAQGLGRLVALGRRAGEAALSHGLDVAKTAAGVAIGIKLAKRFDK